MRKKNPVYQAELFAILQALIFLLTLPLSKLNNTDILIFIYSQSALMSLSNLEHDSQLVQAIYSLYRFLAVFCSIKLNWCPGHKGILGNELTDFFAKQSYAIYKETILKIPLPISELKSYLKVFLEKSGKTNGTIQ